jgi:hypothetical protein
MISEKAFYYILFGIVIIIGIKMYLDSDYHNLKCVVSKVDGEEYCVRERKDIQGAADLLAKATTNCKDLVAYMEEKHSDDERVKRLVEGFNPKKITETLPSSELTAYSENKGEKIAFCLNKSKTGTQLTDLNTLTFVAIHELAHITTI